MVSVGFRIAAGLFYFMERGRGVCVLGDSLGNRRGLVVFFISVGLWSSGNSGEEGERM